jgi:phosphoribosylformimino-5-aminoimidazole carboxamide ribotide isomerase
MRIIPVLDVKQGQVVRGVGGRREEYRPVVSRLTESCRPGDVARAFRDRLGLTELYVADLDALDGAAPALPLYEELHGLGCGLWVDAGVRGPADVVLLMQAGVARVVVGLETVAGPAALCEIGRRFDPTRLCFSLDLRHGQPLGDRGAWGAGTPALLAAEAVAAGFRSLIVLDLAAVGTDSGPVTQGVCALVAAAFPQVELIAGGGIRDRGDLARLAALGVRGALVASALHDGRLLPRGPTEW